MKNIYNYLSKTIMEKLSENELKKIYVVNDASLWKEIISDQEKDHPHFETYKKQKKRLQRLLPFIELNKNDQVAEYGCGNGILADLITKKVGSYVGVDFSAPYIELAKKRQKARGSTNTEFYCEDIIEFCGKNQDKFNQAFAMDFSEHIYDDEFISIFRSVKNSLKDGGKLYIHTPNGDYFLELLKKWGIMKQSKGHVGIRNDREYLKLINKIGFTSIDIHFLSHYISALSLFHFLSFIPFIGKFFRARLFIECTK